MKSIHLYILDAVKIEELATWTTSKRYELPLLNTFWYPEPSFTQCHVYYVLMTVICLAIPTNIIDWVTDRLHIKLP